MSKKCLNCKEVKELSEFYFDSYHKKYRYNCKSCHRKMAKPFNNAYTKTEKGKEAINRASKRAAVKFPEKWNARAKLRYAVKIGKIIKPEVCEKSTGYCKGVQAHHYAGYNDDNWKNVIWLCSQHHAQEHLRIDRRGLSI